MKFQLFKKRQKYHKLIEENEQHEGGGGEKLQDREDAVRTIVPKMISARESGDEEDPSYLLVRQKNLKRRGGLAACEIQEDVRKLKYYILLDTLESCNM